MSTARKFEDFEAVRERVPLLVGLVGPSGSGKTMSALRLATGMQRIVGGDIYGIDTEANRMKHYADRFKFRHVPFGSPFDPLSYLAAVEHCVRKGARTIIIDSASHMHEGPGGTLEAHEAECVRLMAAWKTTRDKVQMSAWQKPKADLRRFLNTVLQLDVNTIWCFRAKEKLKIIPGQQPKPLGFMPIAGDEMVYEMTLNCLLYPASNGVPSWHPEELGERAIVKLPEQFKPILAKQKPLDEDIGEQLARWAAGEAGGALVQAPTPGATNDAPSLISAYAKCNDKAEHARLEDQRRAAWSKLTKQQKAEVKAAADAAAKRSEERSTSTSTSLQPYATDDGAIALIRAATNREELDRAWEMVVNAYDAAGREEIPLPVEDARNLAREKFGT